MLSALDTASFDGWIIAFPAGLYSDQHHTAKFFLQRLFWAARAAPASDLDVDLAAPARGDGGLRGGGAGGVGGARGVGGMSGGTGGEGGVAQGGFRPRLGGFGRGNLSRDPHLAGRKPGSS